MSSESGPWERWQTQSKVVTPFLLCMSNMNTVLGRSRLTIAQLKGAVLVLCLSVMYGFDLVFRLPARWGDDALTSLTKAVFLETGAGLCWGAPAHGDRGIFGSWKCVLLMWFSVSSFASVIFFSFRSSFKIDYISEKGIKSWMVWSKIETFCRA